MTSSAIVNLNVGGVNYTTTIATLTSVKESLLCQLFASADKVTLTKDSQGHYFIDRDGVLFRYILDYLRNGTLVLPENFQEKERLRQEAEYFKLADLLKMPDIRSGPLPPLSRNYVVATTTTAAAQKEQQAAPDSIKSGSITVGYRGTFAFGRDGLADVKFRKLSRLLVCGKVSLCRAVFGDTLNESRDPDRGDRERYTARFFLKHTFLEQAFDMLIEAGFTMPSACGTGTNSLPQEGNVTVPAPRGQTTTSESEEGRWFHYNEFIWTKA